MINQQLLDYIKQQLAAGHDKRAIKEALLNAGWAEQEINEAFDFFFTSSHSAQQPAQQPFVPPQPTLAESVFLGPIKLLSNAWALYRQRFWTLIAVALIPTLVIIAATVASTLGVSFISTFILSKIVTGGLYSLIPMAALFVLIMLAIFLVQIWGQAALLFAIVNNQEGIGVAQSYRRGWHKILSLWWVAMLMTFVVFGGFLLAIVPGVIFAVWFSLSVLVLIAEDSKGMDALLKSREYIRGRWGAVLGRNAFIALLGFVVYLIPNILFSVIFKAPVVLQVVNFIILIAWLPLTIAYMFLMYQNLRSLRGEVDLAIARKSRATFVIIALLGVILIPALLYWAVSPILSIMSESSLNNLDNYTQTTPTPTASEEMAGWRVYRNEKYGFEVKIPQDWEGYVVDSVEPGKFYSSFRDKTKYQNSFEWPGFEIRNFPLSDLEAKAWGLHSASTFDTKRAINNLVAIHFEAYGQKLYAICSLYIDPSVIDICNQILSTFKFIR